MHNEQWVDIYGHREIYQISNYGNVKTKTRDGARRTVVNGHSLSVRDNSSGYLRVNMNLDGKNKQYFVHRLVAKYFVDNPNNFNIVNHIDGNKHNNCFSNLEWVTSSINNQHAFHTGLKQPTIHYGEDSHFHKLTSKDIEYIKLVHKPWDKEFGSKPLAKQFDVKPQTITDIIHGRTWSQTKTNRREK